MAPQARAITLFTDTVTVLLLYGKGKSLGSGPDKKSAEKRCQDAATKIRESVWRPCNNLGMTYLLRDNRHTGMSVNLKGPALARDINSQLWPVHDPVAFSDHLETPPAVQDRKRSETVRGSEAPRIQTRAVDTECAMCNLQRIVSESPITAELQQFIAQHVHSLEQLEILCLLSDYPQESFKPEAVFRSIQSSEKSIADRLTIFANGGVLNVSPDGYRLASRYQGLVTGLAKAYRERRVSVIEIIYRPPTTPIHDFAEAFRLKRKE
jgi:hypothetical protein